jgi:hypothetical protein
MLLAMPSPFPGMDPHLQSPELWRGFHTALAAEIQGRLNEVIVPRYFAALEAYVTYETIEVASTSRAIPAVSVWLRTGTNLESPRGTALIQAPVENEVPLDEAIQIFAVEIPRSDDRVLVTSIELLSLVNKTPGHDAFLAYRRKRRAILASAVHLVEIDLLRWGERPPLAQPLPRPSYYVTVSRSERRPVCELWPVALRESPPVIPVPLTPPDPDVLLDLGARVSTACDRGAFRWRIDYRHPPPRPDLQPDDALWLDDILKRQRAGRR